MYVCRYAKPCLRKEAMYMVTDCSTTWPGDEARDGYENARRFEYPFYSIPAISPRGITYYNGSALSVTTTSRTSPSGVGTHCPRNRSCRIALGTMQASSLGIATTRPRTWTVAALQCTMSRCSSARLTSLLLRTNHKDPEQCTRTSTVRCAMRKNYRH